MGRRKGVVRVEIPSDLVMVVQPWLIHIEDHIDTTIEFSTTVFTSSWTCI